MIRAQRFLPVDHDAREQARHDHDTSLVIEAGAGTGKTTLLVDRIEALVRTGRTTIDRIAAVTFTENAATTMKIRLRERLERARSDVGIPAVERAHATRALEALERAPISTIHALAARLLQERPLECGVAPGFRVMDEAEADRVFAEAWEEWLAESETRGDQALLEAQDREIPLEGGGYWDERSSLRGLARALIEQRDLKPLVATVAVDAEAWRKDLVTQAQFAVDLIREASSDDALAARLRTLTAFAERSRFLRSEELIHHLAELPAIRRDLGQKSNWSSEDALRRARALATWTHEAGHGWRTALSAALHGRLVRALQGVGAIYERRKREEGVLDFLDLLLLVRNALRDRESLRRYFRERFSCLIIDEFQDTDPLQVEIAALLAGDAPGRLVVVGDPKQSIYRFRRAEVALFRRLADDARNRPGHAVLHLTQSFRSRPAILHFVNRVFAQIMTPSEEADQPPYEAITPPPELSDEPAVVALRFAAPHFAEGKDLLSAEAAALAAFVVRVAQGSHRVRDPASGILRRSRAGDVLVLARRLTQIRPLEDAFDSAEICFSVEGGKSFFDRQEVHEVLAVLRAIDDPSDRVSLLAALRSSFLGVSDRDLAVHALSGGSFWMGEVDETLPGAQALGPALMLLHRFHSLRTRISVAQLLERLYDETRVLAALTGSRRGEGRIANLEKVTALARQATDLGALSLRGFVRLLSERMKTAREEPDLPPTRPGDPDTLRVMSIHKAKGLEAPIVVLYDTADDFKPRFNAIPVWEQGTIAVGFRGGCQPPSWQELTRREESRSWAEARRLLYVACTRARDLLVVPQPPTDARVGSFWKDLIAALPAESTNDVTVTNADELPEPGPQRPDLRVLAQAEGQDAVAIRWQQQREDLIQTAAVRQLVPISAVRAATRTAPPPVAAPAETGGRDFGSLVHRVLEWVPWDAPDQAESMARALAPAFGLDAEAASRAARQVRDALSGPLFERARRAKRAWRELPVVFPDGSDLLEGVVDLVFEEENELVVVDYKSDPIADAQATSQAAHHAPQLQLYGRGLTRATGLPVRERLVLFTALGRTVPV